MIFIHQHVAVTMTPTANPSEVRKDPVHKASRERVNEDDHKQYVVEVGQLVKKLLKQEK